MIRCSQNRDQDHTDNQDDTDNQDPTDNKGHTDNQDPTDNQDHTDNQVPTDNQDHTDNQDPTDEHLKANQHGSAITCAEFTFEEIKKIQTRFENDYDLYDARYELWLQTVKQPKRKRGRKPGQKRREDPHMGWNFRTRCHQNNYV